MTETTTTDTFPRQYARTRRFSLGEPRSFRIAPDGARVAFLRSDGGSDANTKLWCLDLPSGKERCVSDTAVAADGELSPDERARRERMREQAEGITAFATDDAVTIAVYTLNGQLHLTDLADLSGAATRTVAAQPGVFDPRPSPDGRWIAYVSNRCLRVVERAGVSPQADRLLMGEHEPDVSWGTPEFIAAEELHRYRGYWWSPDSTRIAAARVDNSPVRTWHIADPAHPERPATVHRYPAAGTPNAVVQLAVLDVETGARTDVVWDHVAFPYLVEVVWSNVGGLTLVVMDRPQRHQSYLAVNDDGSTHSIHDVRDDVWVELTQGTPAWTKDGQLITGGVRNDGAQHALLVGDRSALPEGLQLRRVVDVSDDHIVVTALHGAGGTAQGVWRIPLDDSAGDVVAIAASPDSVVDATFCDGLGVLRSSSLGSPNARVDIVRGTSASVASVASVATVATVANLAELPLVQPRPHIASLGRRSLSTAVLLPSDPALAAQPKLPVLLDPYGGPHAQRVVQSRNAYTTSQWLADQGFAVVIIDGRGTPGKGPAWEKAVHLDLAAPVLEDQVDGLHAAAEQHRQLDLSRVAIRGWSFGGYLAALAVLRRPDVFHAAVAGAPVTEWRLYDTGYTERYLGDPTVDPAPYDRSSLLVDAHRLSRPLMLVHGMADDNVVVAHTLQLSSALLAAGKPHEVLPLSGVTHMTPQEVVAENLLLLQVAFLRRALGI